MYAYVAKRRDEDGGWTPDLPADTPFLQLASPGRAARWALYDFELPYEIAAESLKSVTPAPDGLRALVESATRYPPSLALAAEAVASRFRNQNPPVEEFTAALSGALAAYLDQQPAAPFILAVAAEDELGYLSKGEYYWVVSYKESAAGRPVVRWISSDYQLYEIPAGHFLLSKENICLLSRRSSLVR